MSALVHRIGVVLLLATAALVIPFAAPVGVAQACGCGAFSPSRGGTASVPAETALVRAPESGAEDVYLSLTLDSDVRTGALLFPVPDRHATVSAGPRDLFTELAALTAPQMGGGDTGGGGNKAGAPAPAVIVENRQAIGPLDVVTLFSTDAAALGRWLVRNGFAAKPALTAAAAPYVSSGWAFVAVRLRPQAAAAGALHGQLDPLHLHFASRAVVYPMRLSHLAPTPERVVVYTLAAHRLSLASATPGMATVWAGRVDPAAHPVLRPVTSGGTTFLTKFTGTLAPSTITDDFRFATGPADTPYGGGAVPAGAPFGGRADHIAVGVTVAIVLAGLLAAAVVITQRRRRLPGAEAGQV